MSCKTLQVGTCSGGRIPNNSKAKKRPAEPLWLRRFSQASRGERSHPRPLESQHVLPSSLQLPVAQTFVSVTPTPLGRASTSAEKVSEKERLGCCDISSERGNGWVEAVDSEEETFRLQSLQPSPPPLCSRRSFILWRCSWSHQRFFFPFL